MTNNILITGGGGFIGSHLVHSQLAQGNHVRTIDLHVDRLANLQQVPGLEIICGDFTDHRRLESLVDGVDVIYHLASAHLDTRLSEADYHRINVEATESLIRQAAKAGVKRFIHCSTNGVYGKLTSLPANETSPCHPTNVYEKTKLAGEQAALRVAQEINLPLVVIRPSWVYGPGCPRTEKLFRTIGKGRFVFFGDGHTLRHPVYISDAIMGMELCATVQKASGQIYLIAGEKVISLQELVQKIAELLDVKVSSYHLPVTLGLTAGKLLELVFKPLGKQPPFSQRSLDFFIKDNAYDISKAQHDLGFQPLVNLQTGLEKTLAWLKLPYEERMLYKRSEIVNG